MAALEIPTLEDVTLCIRTPVDPLALPIPWAQLTRFCLECLLSLTHNGGMDVAGAFNVLRRCPNLVHCEIHVTIDALAAESALDTSPIILPYMTTLILGGWRAHLQWIANLVVPSLRSLRVGHMEDCPWHPPQDKYIRFP
ncbi:hypothetical protein K438DRAFT_1846557 [Mycena galopus ATCC 62051]|nr:hypothetical protein K438DRAFT_1846557 [Mycena galopus ATCC 62051]